MRMLLPRYFSGARESVFTEMVSTSAGVFLATQATVISRPDESAADSSLRFQARTFIRHRPFIYPSATPCLPQSPPGRALRMQVPRTAIAGIFNEYFVFRDQLQGTVRHGNSPLNAPVDISNWPSAPAAQDIHSRGMIAEHFGGV
jgi:hypothetical protein